ncbi:MAG: hypothetical protein ABH858_02525 [Candidatus Omnitrophota bacterium]
MLRKKTKGQSTLEYLLLVTGLTVAILYGVNKVATEKAKNQFDTAASIVEKGDTELKTALGLTTTPPGGGGGS